MMCFSKLTGILVISATLLYGCNEKTTSPLITADALEMMVAQQKVVIVSTQTREEYLSGHIPNAIHLYYKNLNDDIPVKGMLKPLSDLVTIFEKNGISNNKTVVIYDNGDAKYAGRLFWAMKYAGLDDVRMLDGNFNAWSAAGKTVSSEWVKPAVVHFQPTIKPQIHVALEEVKSKLNRSKTLIVDVRSPEEFNGKDDRSNGHIMGAVNLPHSALLDSKGFIKSKQEIRSVLKDKGITDDLEIILYCHTSARAGLVYLILSGIMDFNKVRIYDGAYEEWVQSGNVVES